MPRRGRRRLYREGVTDPRREFLEQIRQGGVSLSPELARAFATVRREAFVPDGFQRRDGSWVTPADPDFLSTVYRDDVLVTKVDGRVPVSSSSQPSLMALMITALKVTPGLRILEVGAGTGYNAALLAALGASVTSVDAQEDVADRARISVGPGRGGQRTRGAPRRLRRHPRRALRPGDRDRGVGGISPLWLEQLEDGFVIAPVEHAGTHPVLVVRGDPDGPVSATVFCASGFMTASGPLTADHPGAFPPPAPAGALTGLTQYAEARFDPPLEPIVYRDLWYAAGAWNRRATHAAAARREQSCLALLDETGAGGALILPDGSVLAGGPTAGPYASEATQDRRPVAGGRPATDAGVAGRPGPGRRSGGPDLGALVVGAGEMSRAGDVRAWLRERGAERIAHAGGSLYEHLGRVSERLAGHGARETSLPGGAHPRRVRHRRFSGGPARRRPTGPALRELIGAEAEEMVYRYGGCDRGRTWRALPATRLIRSRFTGHAEAPTPAEPARLRRPEHRQRAGRLRAVRGDRGQGRRLLPLGVPDLGSRSRRPSVMADCRRVLGSDRSPPAGPAVPPRAAVRVVDQPVRRDRPQPLMPGQPARSRAGPAGRAGGRRARPPVAPVAQSLGGGASCVRTAESGSQQVVRRPPASRCSRISARRRSRAKRRAPSPRPAGSAGVRSSRRLVEDRAGQLAVVGPRAAVEVVAAHAAPHVVDDAHLGVDVDRRARVVLQVEDVHPVGRGRPAQRDRLLPADLVGRQREPAVHVRMPRAPPRSGAGRGWRAARRRTAGPPRSTRGTGPPGRSAAGPVADRLGVAAGDGPLAARREPYGGRIAG